MKITNQLVALVAVMVAGLVGLVVCLAVWADWSDGAIVGLVSAFGATATGLVVTVRNQQQTRATLDQLQEQVGAGQQEQTEKLDTVVRQTNGLSERERQDIAERAARSVMEQLGRGGPDTTT